MMGNVFEMCIDSYDPSGYAANSTVDPRPNVPHQQRSWRGGSWDAPVAFCASAKRSKADADLAVGVSGFRIVLAPFEEGSPRQGEDLAFIPPGTFTMGDPLDIPQVNYTPKAPVHQVNISRHFYTGRTEVTQAQYQAITGTNPSGFQASGQMPVESVSWDNAKSYCVRLCALRAAESRLPIGYQYRLPTEAEWERACRGGTNTEFYFGNTANCTDFKHDFSGCNSTSTAPVGTYPLAPHAQHPYGLKDVHGNVMEWCLDSSNDTASYIDPSQPPQLRTDPTGPSGPTTAPRNKKVFRSGCWVATSGECRSGHHRVAPRDWFDGAGAGGGTGSGVPNAEIGFRVALAPRVAWE
jgi:formylglycine-generating enzyme required for sulfatase activity